MPQPKLRGVQVFTYKELEMSTDKFSEANVIGNGGYGVVYKGVLTDGTVAAIKVLQREGKQWERSFRLEVCHFIYYLFFPFHHLLHFFFCFSLSLLISNSQHNNTSFFLFVWYLFIWLSCSYCLLLLLLLFHLSLSRRFTENILFTFSNIG